MGAKVGKDAAAKALTYFDGSVLGDFQSSWEVQGGLLSLSWPSVPGYLYQVQSSPTLNNADFINETGLLNSVEDFQNYIEPSAYGASRFYRIMRQAP